mmetsp:Transcript_14114/g.26121  ORF Transcript_14114/g.26121 Transcript_14114/m.26121 type:complete len:260 (-) Transcript_14114:1281-2060(-)
MVVVGPTLETPCMTGTESVAGSADPTTRHLGMVPDQGAVVALPPCQMNQMYFDWTPAGDLTTTTATVEIKNPRVGLPTTLTRLNLAAGREMGHQVAGEILGTITTAGTLRTLTMLHNSRVRRLCNPLDEAYQRVSLSKALMLDLRLAHPVEHLWHRLCRPRRPRHLHHPRHRPLRKLQHRQHRQQQRHHRLHPGWQRLSRRRRLLQLTQTKAIPPVLLKNRRVGAGTPNKPPPRKATLYPLLRRTLPALRPRGEPQQLW